MLFEILGIPIHIHYIWILAAAIIAFTEVIIPSEESIWSALSALCVAIMLIFGIINPDSYRWQFLWFFALTTVFLLLWFFVLKKRFGKYTNDDRDSSFMGIKGIAIQKIEKGKPGEIELFNHYHGLKKWKAESEMTIEVGEEVEVFETSGIKLRVKKSSVE